MMIYYDMPLNQKSRRTFSIVARFRQTMAEGTGFEPVIPLGNEFSRLAP